MKKNLYRIIKFVILPIFILLFLVIISLAGYRNYLQSMLAEKRAIHAIDGIELL